MKSETKEIWQSVTEEYGGDEILWATVHRSVGRPWRSGGTPFLNSSGLNYKDNPKTPITTAESESVIKSLQKPGSDGFSGEFNQTFKGLIPILLELFQRVEEEGILPNSLYKASVTQTPKSDGDSTRKGNHKPISLTLHRHKNPPQNTSKPQFSDTLQGPYTRGEGKFVQPLWKTYGGFSKS